MNFQRTCVIGLGTIGLPTAKYFLSSGIETYGYDISDASVKRALEEGIKAYTSLESVPLCDVFVICVNTYWDRENGSPSYHPVQETIEKLANKFGTDDYLLAIESTMPFGKVRGLSRIYNLKHVVYVPHRLWPDKVEQYGVNQERVIGGLDDESLRFGTELYGNALHIPLHPVPSIEVAEMSKLVENTHRYLEIAFAEELARLCKSNQVDFEALKSAVSTHFNYENPLEILEPRDGIGGTCLPKDIQFLKASNSKIETPLINGAIEADRQFRKLSIELTVGKTSLGHGK